MTGYPASRGWRSGTLKDLVYFQRGFDITQAQQRPGPYPVVSSSGITSYHDEFMVKGPGVIVGRKGTLGSIHFVPGDYWPHDTTLWSKDLRGNDARFVYYYLHTIDLRRFDVGNSNPTLNRNHIHVLPVRIPPRELQTRIATTVGAYDELIANNARRITLLEQAARLLYDEWFVRLRFPGHEHVRIRDGVPERWERKTIADVSETIGGGTPSTTRSEYWDGDITWVVPSDVTKSGCLVLLDSERKITEAGLRNSSARMVPPNTILMTSRASVGFFALMDREVCTNQGFINIVPHDERLRMYLLFNLLARVDEIRGNAKGSTYPEISKGRFRQMPVIVPPEPLVMEFASVAEPIVRQVRCLKRQNLKLQEARDLLLPRLMSGEVAV